MSDVAELLGLLVSQYQTKRFNVVGADEHEFPAPLDELDAEIEKDHVADSGEELVSPGILREQLSARKGIEHFVAFCRQFLNEHPPETHIMLAQGFGVRLRGGYDVSLTPTEYTNLGGFMENAPAIPVTVGLGSPGMRGVEQTPTYGITSGQLHPGLRGPGA